jgi:hypothetical protein
MNKKPTSKILMGLTAVFAIVAIFVEYAPAFDEQTGPVLGNVFTMMFGVSASNLATVWPLVIAFTALLLGTVLSFAGLLLDGKLLKIVYLTNALLFICAGVLFLFSLKFYGAANGADSLKSVKGLGSGVITTAVFLFLAGASSLGGALIAKNA